MPRLNNTAKVMLGILGDSNEDVRKGLEEDLALLPKKFSTMVIKNAPKIDEAPSAESIEKIAKELAETIADPQTEKGCLPHCIYLLLLNGSVLADYPKQRISRQIRASAHSKRKCRKALFCLLKSSSLNFTLQTL